MKAQQYLRQHYAERAEHRANQARRITGRKDIRTPRPSSAFSAGDRLALKPGRQPSSASNRSMRFSLSST